MSKVDYVEVGRTAYELSTRMGWNAQDYAARLAAEAGAVGQFEEYEFWSAVETWLKARIIADG